MLTAGGRIQLGRVYFVCGVCRQGSHPLDERLGVTGSTTAGAERLLCLAGASWSFVAAAFHLKEFCGLSVSDNTVRKVCGQRAATIEQWQQNDPAAQRPFRQAAGDVEFTTDGTCVNTTEGWKEMRVGGEEVKGTGVIYRFSHDPAFANGLARQELCGKNLEEVSRWFLVPKYFRTILPLAPHARTNPSNRVLAHNDHFVQPQGDCAQLLLCN